MERRLICWLRRHVDRLMAVKSRGRSALTVLSCCISCVLCACLGCGILTAGEAVADPAESVELWTGDIYTSSYRATVCVRPDGSLRGDLLLRIANGHVDEYHFTGHTQNYEVEASHSSGHHFKGRITGPSTVEGTIHLRNGMSVRLKGKRTTQGVQVTPNCEPLDR